MDLKLVRLMVSNFAAHDLESNGHAESEEFYTRFAEIAIKTYDAHQWQPRQKPNELEGLGFYRPL